MSMTCGGEGMGEACSISLAERASKFGECGKCKKSWDMTLVDPRRGGKRRVHMAE